MHSNSYLTNEAGRPGVSPPETALTTHSRQQSDMATDKVGTPEEWRAVRGYEGSYEVSDAGRVRTLDRTITRSDGGKRRIAGRIRRAQLNPAGYSCVVLSLHGAGTTRTVHRLVAEAFILNPGRRPHINHINGVKTDNRAENLEWVTPKENVDHAIRIGLTDNTGAKNVRAVLTEAQAAEALRLAGTTTRKRIAEALGVSLGCVRDVISGRTWTHLGGKSQAHNRPAPKAVYQVAADGTTVLHASIAAAAHATGIQKSAISMVVGGQRKTAGGYEWKTTEGQDSGLPSLPGSPR